MRVVRPFKSNFFQALLVLLGVLSSQVVHGSDGQGQVLRVASQFTNISYSFEDSTSQDAFLYILSKTRGEFFMHCYEKEVQRYRKNIALCAFFGVTTGCALHTDQFKKMPIAIAASINAIAFVSYLNASVDAFGSCSRWSDVIGSYSSLKERLRLNLLEKLGEDKLKVINELSLSDNDLKELVDILTSEGHQATRMETHGLIELRASNATNSMTFISHDSDNRARDIFVISQTSSP